MDLLPPMISEIKIFPNNYVDEFVISNNVNGTFGWDLTIEDSPNGFKSGIVQVTSDYDLEPYIFRLDPSSGTSPGGNIYKNTYPIRLSLNGTICRSQRFWISKVELSDTEDLISSNTDPKAINPLVSFNSTILNTYSIQVTCSKVYNGEGGPRPTLFSFEPSTIDVTASKPWDRMVNFSIMAQDLNYGMSPREEHSPVVYIQSQGTQIISKKTFIYSRDTNGHTHYVCYFEIPYGFGNGQGLMVSVYGF
eukprot:gene10079-12356_t